MDLQGKPAYQQQSCEACAKWQPKICMTCDGKIPQYATTSGGSHPETFDTGFKSPEIHHWHLKAEGNLPLYEAVSGAQCRECYFDAFTAMYPDRKLKIDELPKELNYS